MYHNGRKRKEKDTVPLRESRGTGTYFRSIFIVRDSNWNFRNLTMFNVHDHGFRWRDDSPINSGILILLETYVKILRYNSASIPASFEFGRWVAVFTEGDFEGIVQYLALRNPHSCRETFPI